MDSLTLRKMIDYAETAIRWANEVGSDWAEQEQVRAAVAMYVGQVGEIINHEIPLDEQVANYELFGELGGFRNRIYHHYYRDFRAAARLDSTLTARSTACGASRTCHTGPPTL